jgi:Rrf2 family transcriptional regulator, nitric oxide-sensitive transcriptional repressor
MLSQTAEYALRAVVHLAAHREQAQTAQQIAAATRVPPGYLAKLLQRLARAGIVASQRGVHGGFVLAREPQDLSLLDVVEVVEPVRRITTCPLGEGPAGHGKRLCPLHARLDEALGGVERVLAESRIADLLEHRQRPAPLCDLVPPGAAT